MIQLLLILISFNLYASFAEISREVLAQGLIIVQSKSYSSLRDKDIQLSLDVLETDAYCLKILNPVQDKTGELSWVKKENDQCVGEVRAQIQDLVTFNYKIEDQQIYFEYSYLNPKVVEEKTSIPLINLKERKSQNRLRYSSRNDERGSFSKTWLELRKKERRSLELNEHCFEVNDRCQVIKKYSCENCAEGWLNIVGSGCQKKVSKRCWSAGCGAKDQPACDGGIFLNPIEKTCPKQERKALCHKGLKAFCRNKAEVWCKKG